MTCRLDADADSDSDDADDDDADADDDDGLSLPSNLTQVVLRVYLPSRIAHPGARARLLGRHHFRRSHQPPAHHPARRYVRVPLSESYVRILESYPSPMRVSGGLGLGGTAQGSLAAVSSDGNLRRCRNVCQDNPRSTQPRQEKPKHLLTCSSCGSKESRATALFRRNLLLRRGQTVESADETLVRRRVCGCRVEQRGWFALPCAPPNAPSRSPPHHALTRWFFSCFQTLTPVSGLDDGQSDDTVHALPLALLHGDAFLDNVIFGHDATLKGTPDRQLPIGLPLQVTSTPLSSLSLSLSLPPFPPLFLLLSLVFSLTFSATQFSSMMLCDPRAVAGLTSEVDMRSVACVGFVDWEDAAVGP
eukprot:3870215-Rhodomonas_salina.1